MIWLSVKRIAKSEMWASESQHPWETGSLMGPRAMHTEFQNCCYKCSMPGSFLGKEPVSHQELLPCTINRACKKLFCFEQFALFLPHCSTAPCPMMHLSLQQILKLCPKKKSSSTYTFCKSVGLLGMQFHLFENECKFIAPWLPGGGWQGKGEGGRGLCHPV